jgi:tRNA dimethylallyltransferase
VERIVAVICGPTASGKTKLSIELAKKLNTRIISSDSRQVFKYLDIGTAKPDKMELNAVKHHFIDEIEPDAPFNASMFETGALKIINELLSSGIIPVVAGGSGLYIKALIDGIFDTMENDEELRKELLLLKETKGPEFLYSELQKVDPVSSAKMLPQNWKRVIRALEVYKATGKTIWQEQEQYQRTVDIKFVQYGLKWEREILYDRINKRVDFMMLNGLVEETKNILAAGYSRDLNSLNTVGYKEVISALDGVIDMEKAVELIKRNTRRFAKRQMTWFRRDERINWLPLNSETDIAKAAEKIFIDITK